MSRRVAREFDHAFRRASAAVVMVIVLVVLQLAIVGAIVSGGGSGGVESGGGGTLTQSRLDATRSFYAAEAGVNMSLREIMFSTDEDGDGVIGGVSDDGVDANDPHLGADARVRVGRTTEGDLTVLTSRASAGNARRVVRTTLD